MKPFSSFPTRLKRLLNKGIALIMTMTVLTALSMLGITFLGLLSKDQKLNVLQSSEWLANSSLYSAIQAGIFEINYQTNTESHFFHSIIQSASDTSLIYFRNAIRSTNAKLSLSQEGPEMWHVLSRLTQIIAAKPPVSSEYGTSFFTNQMTNLINCMRLYTRQIPEVFTHPSELVMIPDVLSTFSARAYSYLLPYVTTYPMQKSERIVNIIDYGMCDDQTGMTSSQIKALNRNFKPVSTIDSVAGAYIKIISGSGTEQLPKKIKSADNTQGVLNLWTDWDNTLELPDPSSVYRIYSYVVPLNFNAASIDLMQANFSVLSEYFSDRYSPVDYIGDYNAGTSSTFTFMRQLKYFREENIITSPPIKIRNFNDFKMSYLDRITDLVSDEDNKKEVLRQFDPTQPKGIQVGAEIHIYPVPLPFTFSHNGYFDMDIDHTYQFSNYGAPRNLKHHALTVKVGTQINLNTAEDFRSNGKPHWMSLSDWVPTRNLNDFQNWSRIYNYWNGSYVSNFNAYATPSNDSTVIPDALKTGLWFDFTAIDTNQNRENDLIYNPLNNVYIQHSQLASMFYNATSGGRGTHNLNTSTGTLDIAGDDAGTPKPQAKIYLGPDSGTGSTLFDFGDVSVRFKLYENTSTWPYFSHPPFAGGTWYPSLGASPSLAQQEAHLWDDHQTATINTLSHKTYPPRRYFTPALFVRGNVELRNEIGYLTSPFENPYVNCYQPLSASGEEALYAEANATSISFNGDHLSRYRVANALNMTDPLEAKVTVFTLTNDHASILTRQNMGNANFTRIDSTAMPLLTDPLPVSSPDHSLLTSGPIGFMRYFPDEYYSPETSLPFSVEYLRINPNRKQITYPYFETNVLNIKDAVRYKTISVHYRIGLFGNKTFNNITFDIVSELDLAPGAFFVPDMPAKRITINFNDLSVAEGHLEFDLKDPVTFPSDLYPSTNGDVTKENFKIRLSIEKNSNDPEIYHNLLNTTIAITGISVYADTKNTSLSVSNVN